MQNALDSSPISPSMKSFLQSDIWGSFREGLGWYAHKVSHILVLERRLPFGKSFLYSPEVTGTPDLLLELYPEVIKIARHRNSIFYRLELLIDKNDPLAEEWLGAFHYTGFKKSFESVQPEHRQIIPLSSNEEKVLAQMKPKGRYNIRLADKLGVRIRESSVKSLDEDVAIFYHLFEETAKRDKFSIRSQSYFSQLCHLLYEHDCGRLFIAMYENQPLAAAIITLYDKYASYLYGASASHNRHVMAPYALHWTAMQWAASRGATHYDLLAIRPPGDKPHPYDGITRFKQQFGGESVHLLGSWDRPIQNTWYNLFKIIEGLRR